MFERYFLDAYEGAGATIVATCRDLDDPDRWVWMRAFDDGAAREAALARFYTSDTWRTRAEACNATIADVGDAWLLRAARADGLQPPTAPQPPGHGAHRMQGAPADALIEVSAHALTARAAQEFESLYLQQVVPALAAAGAAPLAVFTTATDVQRNPRRPTRAGQWLFSLSRFASAEAHATHVQVLAASRAWQALQPALARAQRAPPARWRLQPTARSALR